MGIPLSLGLDQSIFRLWPDMGMPQPQGHVEIKEDIGWWMADRETTTTPPPDQASYSPTKSVQGLW